MGGVTWGLEEEVNYVVTGASLVERNGQSGSGGIWFRSSVGEEVILRMIREIQDIRRENLDRVLKALSEGNGS